MRGSGRAVHVLHETRLIRIIAAEPGCDSGLMSAMSLRIASARRSALLCRGPYGAAGGGRKVRQDGSHGGEPVFRRYMDVPSENPGTHPRTRSPWMGGGRAIGVPFLFGSFLFGHAKRKELGRRQAHETALRLARNKSAPSPQPSPPTMFGERENGKQARG